MAPAPTAQCRPSMTGTYMTSMMKQPIARYFTSCAPMRMPSRVNTYAAMGWPRAMMTVVMVKRNATCASCVKIQEPKKPMSGQIRPVMTP